MSDGSPNSRKRPNEPLPPPTREERMREKKREKRRQQRALAAQAMQNSPIHTPDCPYRHDDFDFLNPTAAFFDIPPSYSPSQPVRAAITADQTAASQLAERESESDREEDERDDIPDGQLDPTPGRSSPSSTEPDVNPAAIRRLRLIDKIYTRHAVHNDCAPLPRYMNPFEDLGSVPLYAAITTRDIRRNIGHPPTPVSNSSRSTLRSFPCPSDELVTEERGRPSTSTGIVRPLLNNASVLRPRSTNSNNGRQVCPYHHDSHIEDVPSMITRCTTRRYAHLSDSRREQNQFMRFTPPANGRTNAVSNSSRQSYLEPTTSRDLDLSAESSWYERPRAEGSETIDPREGPSRRYSNSSLRNLDIPDDVSYQYEESSQQTAAMDRFLDILHDRQEVFEDSVQNMFPIVDPADKAPEPTLQCPGEDKTTLIPVCGVCYEPFDTVARRPLITSCGHTTCEVCCQQIRRGNDSCAICRKKFYTAKMKVNYTLVDAIASIQSLELENAKLKKQLEGKESSITAAASDEMKPNK